MEAVVPLPRAGSRAAFLGPSLWRALLPFLTLMAVLVPIFVIQPRTMSYFGLNLLLNLAVPIMLATLAQMCVMTVNDLDLGIGPFVSFTACVGATQLAQDPLVGAALLLGGILAYAVVGALIHLRRLPSIVVTLGMSFVWLGLAILVLPSPGGAAPGWLRAAVGWKPPYVPLPILAGLALAVIGWFFFMRTSLGAVLRGAGGNAVAVERSGWSLLQIKVGLYTLAGFLGTLSGLTLLGLATSADSGMAGRYTLLSIAGAILGGSDFTGGRISPVGAVTGAIVLTLASSFLSFMRISPDWQVGAQGAILIIVLALRALTTRGRAS